MGSLLSILYTNLHCGHRFPQFGTCSGLFQGPSPAIYTYVIIYVQAHAKLVIHPGQIGNVGPISNFTISIFFTKGAHYACTRGSRPLPRYIDLGFVCPCDLWLENVASVSAHTRCEIATVSQRKRDALCVS